MRTESNTRCDGSTGHIITVELGPPPHSGRRRAPVKGDTNMKAITIDQVRTDPVGLMLLRRSARIKVANGMPGADARLADVEAAIKSYNAKVKEEVNHEI